MSDSRINLRTSTLVRLLMDSMGDDGDEGISQPKSRRLSEFFRNSQTNKHNEEVIAQLKEIKGGISGLPHFAPYAGGGGE